MITLLILIGFGLLAGLGIYWAQHYSADYTCSRGLIEIVVQDGEACIEGILRILKSHLRHSHSVRVIVICSSSTDHTVRIVQRLHKRDPWFSLLVVNEGEEDVLQAFQPLPSFQPFENHQACRIDVGATSNMKETIGFLSHWLQQT
jgi:hypothetical protein